VLRLALLSIRGLSIMRSFNRMTWPAVAREPGVTPYRSNTIEILHRKIDAGA
jgi:hypothetical protein